MFSCSCLILACVLVRDNLGGENRNGDSRAGEDCPSGDPIEGDINILFVSSMLSFCCLMEASLINWLFQEVFRDCCDLFPELPTSCLNSQTCLHFCEIFSSMESFARVFSIRPRSSLIVYNLF